MADALRRGDTETAADLSSRLIVPFNNNLVPRPWGGSRMRDYKGIAATADSIAAGGHPVGEAFEISAYDLDAEAERYPSVVGLGDGSAIELPDLLAANGPALLGDAFVERYGACMPLLPKTLDVKELLSVQGHPSGNTEVYIIIDADPGATIRLGFSMDIDAVQLRDELVLGRREQAELLQLFAGRAVVAAEIQAVLAPWLAVRGASADVVASSISRRLESVSDWPAARVLLERIKRLYWRVLDSLNELPLSPGQVIYNATPSRLVGKDGVASAEVHALGNPECREILALEIRRPGPTFRAWDNVRFPLRDIDIDKALNALNLRATVPDEFVVFPELVPGRPGVYCSVDSSAFRIEHLRPDGGAGDRIEVRSAGPHCLHVIGGAVDFVGHHGNSIGQLRKGESALVPIGVSAYTVTASRSGAEVIKVDLPVQ
jgi:mannose-6-phosphate isomerase class I